MFALYDQRLFALGPARQRVVGVALCSGLCSPAAPVLADEKITYLFPAPPLLPAFGPIQLAKGKALFLPSGP